MPMKKSLGRMCVAVVAAVGIVMSPVSGLALAEPSDDTVVTTTLAPPPDEPLPPEPEVLPPEPQPELPSEPSLELPLPPTDEPASEPPVADPPVSEPAEEDLPPANPSPSEPTMPADEPVLPPEPEIGGELPSSTDATPSTPASEPPQPLPSDLPAEPTVSPKDELPSGEVVPLPSPSEEVTVPPENEANPEVASVPEAPKADQADLQQVFAKEPLVQKVEPAPVAETDEMYNQIKSSYGNRNPDDHDSRPDRDDGRDRDHDRWDGKVKPWSHHWIKYDHPRHHGPVFGNPFHDRHIKIFYVYQGHQYVRVIPPRQSIFVDVDVRVHGVHSFTAVHVKAGGVVVDVNVGTFHHPTYVPPVHTNVHVKVVVNNHYYPRPFTVKKVVDCGYDNIRHKTKVVFDGTYVAWGHWKGHGKDRHFALEESATYPGMYGKAAEVVAAPPEPYVKAAQPRNVAAETDLVSGEGYLIGVGALALAGLVGMLIWSFIRRRSMDS